MDMGNGEECFEEFLLEFARLIIGDQQVALTGQFTASKFDCLLSGIHLQSDFVLFP